MDIAVTGVAETGDRKTAFGLEGFGNGTLRRSGLRRLDDALLAVFGYKWIARDRMVAWALLAGGMLAFALSFDEVIVTSFIAGKYETVPKKMFNELILEVNPTITAVATLLKLYNDPNYGYYYSSDKRSAQLSAVDDIVVSNAAVPARTPTGKLRNTKHSTITKPVPVSSTGGTLKARM